MHAIMIYDNVKFNNGGPLDPSDTGEVVHNEITLFYNTIIIILAVVITLSFWVIDRENKLKKVMLILIILFSIFTPIMQIYSYKNAITIAGERKDMRKDEQIKNYNLIQVFLKGLIYSERSE